MKIGLLKRKIYPILANKEFSPFRQSEKNRITLAPFAPLQYQLKGCCEVRKSKQINKVLSCGERL